jgi:hypothetical protein
MSLIWKTIFTVENYFFCSFIPVGWNNNPRQEVAEKLVVARFVQSLGEK